ncbi:MAG TPA: hypothetical protein VGE05_03825 [Novosphingobium sp.]
MKRFAPLAMAVALVAVGAPVHVAAQAATTVSVSAGMMLYDAAGLRIGKVYRVNASGDPQVILDGRLVTVPAATLSDAGGKLTTSLARKDVGRRG